MTHYDTLGVPPDASPEDIKRAFRRAASAAHPDREGGSTERMQLVNRAHEVLSDPNRRARYDSTGNDEASNVEKMATDLLMQTFERALQGDGDPVRAATRHLKGLREQVLKAQAEIVAEQVRLKGRTGKVKVKKGENLVQVLIDRKLHDLAQRHAQTVEALAVHALATKMLESYEGEPESPPQPGYYDHGIDAMMYAMQCAQQRRNPGWNGL